jgi:hypothetical protein
MFMIMYVSKDVEQASEMLDVWVKAGVKGVTILESAGMQQVSEQAGIRADVGIMFSLNKLLRATEIHHRTLFSAISDQETVDTVVAASTAQIGDWSRPDVGVLFVLPMIQAYGIEKKFK